MFSSRRHIAAAIGSVLITAGGAAWADPADTKIQQLEAKVAQLEARQSQDNKAVAATIEGVLRDAEKRSQLLATNGDASSGYDNGFFIRSGDFTLRPGVQFQFRNITDYREETDGPKDDEIENGFEVRRLKFELTGTAFSKDLSYAFIWATDREGGSLILEDAFVKYMFADDWGLRAGQFKDPGNSHEELVSSKRQLAVDRSLTNEVLNGGVLDRVQGVTLIYGGYNKNNPLNVEIGLHDGANSDNSDYTGHLGSPGTISSTGRPGSHAFDFGVGGRAEYKFMGDWKNYAQFSALNVKEDTAVLGGGFDWSQGGDGDAITAFVDISYQNANGLSLYAAAHYRHLDGEIAASADKGEDDGDNEDFGVVLQAGYMLNPAWEIFGRYAGIWFDDDFGDDESDDFHEFTVGVNYFLGNNGSAGHRAKVTIDLNYLPEGTPNSQKGIGYLGDGDDEIVIRGQFQLLI
jgi:outer membrane murein-binding lipoprotein Lpp